MKWKIQLLGGLRAEQAERVINRFRTRKAGVLLAYLAFYRQEPHSREKLIEMLWSEQDPDETRHKLRQALSTLRRQLEPPGASSGTVLLTNRAAVQLNAEAFVTDVTEFEAALQAAGSAGSGSERMQHLAEAAGYYGGGLLPGYFEGWILPERQRLAERFQGTLTQLIRLREQSGDLSGAIEWARRAVTADPLREEAQHELIRLLATAGQPEAARRQYQELERLLNAELGAAPASETQDLIVSAPRIRVKGSQTRKSDSRSGKEPGSRRAAPVGSWSASSPTANPSSGPTGTVTFLLTDIEGSTALWERSGGAFRSALESHHALLRREFRRHGGYEIKEAGDSFVIAFAGASDAAACAVAAQQALANEEWPASVGPLHVRMMLHTGDVEREKGEYRGLVLHHAARMLAAAHGGQILCSEVAAGLLRHAAPGSVDSDIQITDLGLYRLRDMANPERLFQLDHPGVARREFPPLAIPPAYDSQVPVQLTRFFGREAEIARLCEALGSQLSALGSGTEARDTRLAVRGLGRSGPAEGRKPRAESPRLITLTGPGGSGKTRLALEVGHRLAERATTVYFVPLADLPDAALIADALRDALQLPAAPRLAPLEHVIGSLSRRPALLLLDNFEHLLEGGPRLVRTLLERLPLLTCLITSRQPLGMAGERIFPVLPLPIPVDGCWSMVDRPAKTSSSEPSTINHQPSTLVACPSVQLFVDRAQAVRPDFQVTPRNAAAVAELCRRLEGIPLALELAAARARLFSVPQMLVELERRFEFLISRRRDQPPRHQSLRAALDWSYQLLSPELRLFFARLSVFRGGWTAAAAARICLPDLEAPSTSSSSRGIALDYLDELHECSFILTVEDRDEIRYRHLETLREYGGEQLAPEQRHDAARRHAEYYLDLAERAEPELRGSEQAAWLGRLTPEEDNLRAALAWSAESGAVELGLRLAAALLWFWHMRGHHAEVRGKVAELLALAEGDHEVARARAVHAAGHLAFLQLDLPAAARLLDQSLSMYRRLGDKRGIAWSLRGLADAANMLGHPEAARSSMEESMALFRELGDRWGICEALGCLASLAASRGDFPTARRRYGECVALYREMGDSQGIAWALNSLGQVAQRQGDLEAAWALHEESLAIWQALDPQLGSGWSLMNLGHIARARGDLDGAAALYDQWETAVRGITPDSSNANLSFSRARLALDRHEPGVARSLLERCMPIFQRQGDQSTIAHCHLHLGQAAQLEGDHETARSEYAVALSLFREMKDRWAMVLALEAFAGLAAMSSEAGRAVRLFGAAAAQRDAMGAPLPPSERAGYEQTLVALRDTLGEAGFAAAWAEGGAMPLDLAVNEALGQPA